jgi:hypothetical protein
MSIILTIISSILFIVGIFVLNTGIYILIEELKLGQKQRKNKNET